MLQQSFIVDFDRKICVLKSKVFISFILNYSMFFRTLHSVEFAGFFPPYRKYLKLYNDVMCVSVNACVFPAWIVLRWLCFTNPSS